MARATSLLAVLLLCFALPDARAEPVEAPDLYSDEALQARTQRLEAVKADLANARERREALQREIDTLENDRATLTAALVTVAARRQEVQGAIAATRARLEELSAELNATRARVEGRRDVLIEVLAALQRMGAEPPPALVVAPNDAVGSVRSAILLGAVVPQLRARTRVLLRDLEAFEAVRAGVVKERETLSAQLRSVDDDATRLTLLAERKKSLIAGSRLALLAEQRRAAALAERATSLSGLIADLEEEILSARKASAAARAADERRLAREAARIAAARADIAAAREAGKPLSAGVFSDAGRVEPAIAFGEAKGLLPMPAAGTVVRRFGDALPAGRRRRGREDARALNMAIRTPPGAHVRTPADGWVLYAGPFRSYGNLLIVNAGDGYHIVMMGLDSVSVSPGRFVLAGEPVGRMAGGAAAERRAAEVIAVADKAATAASDASGTQTPPAPAGPVLTVEFRAKGDPVDPSPWWAKGDRMAANAAAPRL